MSASIARPFRYSDMGEIFKVKPFVFYPVIAAHFVAIAILRYFGG